MRGVLFAALVLVACNKELKREGVHVDAAPVATTVHFALFDKSVLLSCADVAVPMGVDASVGPPGALVIDKPCTEQFADRTVFGTCMAKGSSGASLAERHYDFDGVASDDQHMKNCLEMHGQWTELPKDSREYQRAKLEHDAQHLRDLSKRLQKP